MSAITPLEKKFGQPELAALAIFAIGLAGLLVMVSLAIGEFYEPNIEQETFKSLTAIARMKANEIDTWRAEREHDAESVFHDTYLAADLVELDRDPQSEKLRTKLQNYVDRILHSYEYGGVCILDISGNPRAIAKDCDLSTPGLLNQLRRPVAQGVWHSDIYREGNGDIHIDWLVPIFTDPDSPTTLIAWALFRANADKVLFPLLQNWPTNSSSGEALIIRQEGNSAVYLNNLRYRQDSALAFSMPMDRDDLPAVIALKSDVPGTVQSRDYRNVPVYAAYQPIYDFNWRLITKIDQDEVLAPVRTVSLWIQGLAVAALIVIAGLVNLYWRQRQRLDRALQISQDAREALARKRQEEQFASVFTLSPLAAAISTTADGKFCGANKAFKDEFGWSEAELIGRTSIELGIWPNPSDLSEWHTKLAAEGRLIGYETVMRRRDNADRQVSLSATYIELNGLQCTLAYVVDITERVEMEAKLVAEQERLTAILEGAGDALFITDVDGNYKNVNRQACAMLGYSEAELTTMNIRDVTPTFDIAASMAAFQRLSETDAVRAELTLKTKSGGLVPVEINATRIPDNLFLSACRDITDRLAKESELQKLSLAVTQSPVSVAITNTDGQLEYVNEAFERATGYSREEVLGKNPSFLKSGLTPKETYLDLWDTLTAGATWHGEFFNRRKDGSISIESADIAPLRGENGDVTHYIAVKEDITEKKRMAKELEQYRDHLEDLVAQKIAELDQASETIRENDERLGFALEATNDGVWDWHQETRKFYANAAYYKMFGFEPGELNQTIQDLWINRLNAQDRKRVRDELWESLRISGTHEIEIQMRQKDDTLKWVLCRSKVVTWDNDNNPLRVVGALTDLSARKQIELDLLDAKHAAESANFAKSAFLANMSHEIRTPMNAIVGLTHVLRRTPLSQQQNESLDKISVATSHLMSIINDILDLSKIEADRLVLESVDFNLKVLLDNVYSIFFEQANSKGVNLSVNPGSGPHWLNGDPTRIRQALLNFVSNAIKFTQTGTIRIGVQHVTNNEAGILLRFEVTDTGIGIPPDRLARLFSAFEQADASTTRKYGGTGLGLAITKKLALLMGGDAGATSAFGTGSTFWFTAYLRPGVEAERIEAKSTLSDWETSLSRAAGKRILVADDLAVNRELIASLLEPSGLIIDLAIDGLDAVAKARANDYGLILMDVQMPNLDGMGAARAIHALPGKSALPIIAVTANVFVEDRLACKAAGMIDFLSKPVDPPMLYYVVAKWLGLPSQSPSDLVLEGTSETHAEALPNSTIIDAARGLRTWGGNAAQYGKFLKKFAADYCSGDLGFEPMIEPPDLVKAIALAHKIKGAAANLAIVDVSSAAGALECALKNTQAANEELSVLKTALSRAAIEIACLYPVSETPSLASAVADSETPVNHHHLQADLTALLHALNSDNPDGIEFLIENLVAKLPTATLKPIKEAVDDFDFRRAEELVRQIEQSLT